MGQHLANQGSALLVHGLPKVPIQGPFPALLGRELGGAACYVGSIAVEQLGIWPDSEAEEGTRDLSSGRSGPTWNRADDDRPRSKDWRRGIALADDARREHPCGGSP